MTTLLIDIGNTSLHWRKHVGNEKVAEPTFSYRHQRDWQTALNQVAKTTHENDIKTILVASVSGKDVEAVIQTMLQNLFGQTAIFIKTEKTRNEVINAYQQPAHLGVDRWLGIQAGFSFVTQYNYAAALVIDAGTAMTIDAVLNTGEHLGGSIIAGWNMQQRTLLTNTQEIFASDGALDVFADNTASAVSSGALIALLGAISLSYSKLQQTVKPEDPIVVILSGGDSELLEEALVLMLDTDVHVTANIVLDGLSFYASTPS